MRKIILLFILFAGFAYYSDGQTPGKWDQNLQIRKFDIKIRADYFKAKTFIEIEFYNPRNTEMEALYSFSLHPGQVITAFQLDLNGKFRDGSIEEKWKATNAYNTIVGKRVDPALLRMESPNSYSLRVYPVPAKGSRRVTITIEQLMKSQDEYASYALPLMRNDSVSNFNLKIDVVHSTEKPVTEVGFIRYLNFIKYEQKYFLDWSVNKLMLNNSIQFSIPFPKTAPVVCTQKNEGDMNWGIRLNRNSLEKQYSIHPKKIRVYWDVSMSGAKRNIRREMRFLEQYISYNDIEEVTIVPFNHQMQDSVVFYPLRGYNNNWQQYIRKLEYDGATKLGCINLDVKADLVLLFSDGQNSFGKPLPEKGSIPVHAVFDAYYPNKKILEELIEGSGGQLIDLDELTPSKAISVAGMLDCYLMGIKSSKGKLIFNQYFPINVQSLGLLSGTTSVTEDILELQFGNGNGIRRVEKVTVSSKLACDSSGLERIPMLCSFQSKITQGDWLNTIEFGMIEKVVTPFTAYIVLEKVEDYIKYNIAPPAELEEKCRELNFVKKDYKKQIEEIRNQNQWNLVIGEFNQMIRWYNNDETLIDLNGNFGSSLYLSASQSDFSRTVPPLNGNLADMQLGSRANALNEVVVVGYGSAIKRDLTGSVAVIRERELLPGISIDQQLAGRVAGVNVTSSGFVGEADKIRIRGASSLYGSRSSQPLYVIDGIPYESLNVLEWLSPNDIESITILKDASAAAVYGSRGANGVILVTTKKGRRSFPRFYPRTYKLKNEEDADYIQEIQSVPVALRINKYDELKIEYGDETAFFFDMADHFHSIGKTEKAVSILLNAAEISNGNFAVLKAMGHYFEKWKMWDKAIEIFTDLAQMTQGIQYYRDLAWCFYQAGKYQEAVNTFYSAILLDAQDPAFKATILSEMNAVIVGHKEQLDLKFIPSNLIKPLPVDLRIIVEGDNQSYNTTITDAEGKKRSAFKPEASKNWRIDNVSGSTRDLFEYQIKKAKTGKYTVSINYFDYGYYKNQAPRFFRIISFYNYGRANQKLSIEMVNLDNQAGEIEVSTIDWRENNK